MIAKRRTGWPFKSSCHVGLNMFKKVIIAEDQEMANISVRTTLAELNIPQLEYVYYCDDALEEIRRAMQAKQPYDLLITDLIFDPDARAVKLAGGKALIEAARALQPDLKVLVFSAEGKPATIDMLVNKMGVDGYIRKARNDMKELRAALEAISQHRQYLPRSIADLIKTKYAHSFTSFEITIIGQLAKGVRQKDIPAYLRSKDIKPSGLSSVEKCLNALREKLDFSNNEQLVLFCKEKGII